MSTSMNINEALSIENFSDFFNDVKSNNKLLPLIHCTDLFTFRKILLSGELITSICPVFKKELLYFFYGRPAYKVSSNKICCSSNPAFLPVSFLFEPTKLTGIEHIYPFDSGAFYKGMFRDYMHYESKIDDFALNKDIALLINFVEYFYGSNQNYLLGKKNVNLPTTNNIELITYRNIIEATGNMKIDDRKFTIEVGINKKITLSGKVSFVVLPHEIMGERTYEIIDSLWKAKLYHYPAVEGGNIDNINGAMHAIIYQILRENDYFE